MGLGVECLEFGQVAVVHIEGSDRRAWDVLPVFDPLDDPLGQSERAVEFLLDLVGEEYRLKSRGLVDVAESPAVVLESVPLGLGADVADRRDLAGIE